MSNSSIITYNEKSIIFINNKNLKEQDVVENTKNGILKLDKNKKDNLLLLDMSDVFITPDLDKKMKELGIEASHYCKKTAIVGMASGVKKVIVTGFLRLTNSSTKLFDTIDDAKSWLSID